MNQPTIPQNLIATAPLTVPHCTAYGWCAEIGEHDHHTSTRIAAGPEDAYGNEVLDTVLLEWGHGVKVGLLDADHTPAEARIILAQLRGHLNVIETLINIAEKSEAGE